MAGVRSCSLADTGLLLDFYYLITSFLTTVCVCMYPREARSKSPWC